MMSDFTLKSGASDSPGKAPGPDAVNPENGIRNGWSLKASFAALQYPNYRLWFIGQMASLVGTFMQMTALGFFVYELTRSPAYLGYVGFAAGLPSWFFMLYGGVVSDRMPRRKLLMIAQTYMMTLACVLAGLTFSGLIRPWHILVISFLSGIGNAFDAPARHSFVLEMVSREDLTNGIALNSIMFNLANMAGPALAGVLYALTGPGVCFLINAVSFLAVIAALQMMKIPNTVPRSLQTSALHDLAEGLRYIASHRTIPILMGIAGIISLFCMSFVTLIPAWAVNVLKGDAATNGWLQSARGAGAFSGALMIAMLGRFHFKGRLISIGMIFVPCLLILFSFITWIPISLAVLVGIGWGIMTVFNLVNASIQMLVSDELRGRVMSVYSLVFFGSMPLGALMAGWLAEYTSEPLAVLISAILALCLSVWIWIRRPGLRRLDA